MRCQEWWPEGDARAGAGRSSLRSCHELLTLPPSPFTATPATGTDRGDQKAVDKDCRDSCSRQRAHRRALPASFSGSRPASRKATFAPNATAPMVPPCVPAVSRSARRLSRSIVSETADGATIGAGPGDPVAGHAPEIFFHTVGTHHESATAGPAKELLTIAGRTYIFQGFAPSCPVTVPLRVRLFCHESFYLRYPAVNLQIAR